MKNPWIKKNPFMSLWLSGANSMLGRTRAQAVAVPARQHATLTQQATRFWTSAWLAAVKPRRRR
jgi:hypothetical protein